VTIGDTSAPIPASITACLITHYRCGGQAAAIAAHLYDFPRYHDDCVALAQQYGLTFELPDYPSWWNPGRPGGTVLVLYTGPAGRI